MEKLRLAIIGCRGHYSYVFHALAQLPRIELCAVSAGCDDSAEPLLDAAAKLGIAPKLYEDYRELLDAEKPNIVAVDGPFERHAEMCVEALTRRIHVFCEKPIALELEDLDRVRRAFESAGEGVELISMVGLRAEAPFRTAREAVRNGVVGTVRMINARKSYKLGERPDFYRRRATYGGTIPWVGSHAFDWILWFGGAPFRTIQAVQSCDGNRAHGELEAAALCMGTLENGVLFSASIDYLRPMGAPTHGDDQLRVAGDDGVVEVAHGRVTLTDRDGLRELTLLPDRNIFFDFANHLLTGEPALVDSEETFRLTEACLLAREAADAAAARIPVRREKFRAN